MINGATRLVGLIGWPVEHSLSPAMHNAAFAALGLNWVYVPLPVPPGALEAAVKGLAALGFRGANVTVPHKQAVMPYLDELTEAARAIGAVNTIIVRDGRLTGDNTDAEGFIRALREGGFKPQGSSVMVLGAGGAARAVVYALLSSGTTEVRVLNRTYERAVTLVEDFGKLFPQVELKPLPLNSQALAEAAGDSSLLVNATSVGMWPHVEESPWPEELPFPSHLTVFDLVYNPQKTKLLRQAEAAGARIISGLGMLLHQGARAFELWTRRKPHLHIMRESLQKHAEQSL